MASADQPGVRWRCRPTGALPRTSGGYIGQFDSFRVIACCAVVLQHSLLWTIAAGNTAAWAFVMLLHFSRTAFFFLAAFLLTYSQITRPRSTLGFWRRRYVQIGVPFLAWTAIYWIFTMVRATRGTKRGRSSGTTWCSAITSSTSRWSCYCCTWSSRRCSGRSGPARTTWPSWWRASCSRCCWRRTSTTPRPSVWWGTGCVTWPPSGPWPGTPSRTRSSSWPGSLSPCTSTRCAASSSAGTAR